MFNNCNCPYTYTQCNNVVNTCNVSDMYHYTNYHTHVINNCIKRHINVPIFTKSEEVVYYDQYIDYPNMCGNNVDYNSINYNLNQASLFK